MLSYTVLIIVLSCAFASSHRQRYRSRPKYYETSSYERTRPTYYEPSSYEHTQQEHQDTSYYGQNQPTYYDTPYVNQTQLIIDNETLSQLYELEDSLQQLVYKVGILEGLSSTIRKPVVYHSNSDSGASTQLMYLLMKKIMMNKGDEYKEKESITDCNKDGYEWVEAFGNCIKLHHEELTYGEARLKCIEEGSDLVVLDTEAKNDALVERLALLAEADWFIGLSDINTEGTFEWVNGELLANTFVDWGGSDPNGQPGDGDCVQIDFQASASPPRDGEWYDRDCHSPQKFVCESKKKEPKDEKSYSYSYGYKYEQRIHAH